MIQRAIIIFTSFIFTLFLLEAGVRIFLPQSDRLYTNDPASLTLKPKASGMWYGQHPFQREFAIPITINRYGFRDVEYTQQKPADTFRIIVIGDSFVEALQVPLEQTFFKQLEQKLAEYGGKNVEVLGFGKSGLGAVEKRKLVEKSMDFDPDFLIVLLNPTDLNDAINLTPKKRLEIPFFGFILDYSHIARLSIRSLRSSFFQRRDKLPPLKIPDGVEGEKAWSIVENEIQKMRGMAGESDVPLILFIEQLYVIRDQCKGDFDSAYEQWKQIVERTEVPSVLMGKEICSFHTDEDPVYFPLDRHWTERGHAIAAGRLFAYLAEIQRFGNIELLN